MKETIHNVLIALSLQGLTSIPVAVLIKDSDVAYGVAGLAAFYFMLGKCREQTRFFLNSPELPFWVLTPSSARTLGWVAGSMVFSTMGIWGLLRLHGQDVFQ